MEAGPALVQQASRPCVALTGSVGVVVIQAGFEDIILEDLPVRITDSPAPQPQ